MAKLQLPHISGTTPAEQISQLRAYLYQLVGDLQWILDTIETGESTVSVSTSSSTPSKSPQETLREVQALIIQSTAIFDAYYDKMTEKLKNSKVYAEESNFPEGSAAFVKKVNEALESEDEIILTSPNGTNYLLSVDDSGIISATAL